MSSTGTSPPVLLCGLFSSPGPASYLTFLSSFSSRRAARVILHRALGSAIREDAALGPWGVAALESWTLKASWSLGN